ncbi:MAG: GNAT family N-acetyltransferase [Thermoguttaceae bacterium]
MTINIRLETESDHFTVETITRQAFWNLYVPGCNEHLIVHNLRSHTDCIPELCFVIEQDNEIVGSIFYSKSKVVDFDGSETKTITFGPVSINPKFHRTGLGRKLISYSIEQAKAQGYGAIVIGGFPYHYKTYGFVGAKKFNIALDDGNYYTGIMALPLIDGYLDNIRKGVIHFSQGMTPDESLLDAFDANFPPMIKETKESQMLFEEAVAMIDTRSYYE